MDERALIEWARAEAERLDKPLPDERTGDRAELTKALEFLRTVAADTEFYGEAKRFVSEVRSTAWEQARVTAKCLTSWADFVEGGLANAAPYPVQARRDAATDLMEQVRQLLDDSAMNPAAAVMLAGAALEEALRSMVLARPELELKGKPSIATYGNALRSGGVISAQQRKDVEAWAGLRNTAAHGNFEEIDPGNARLMEQGVNLFLQQLSSC